MDSYQHKKIGQREVEREREKRKQTAKEPPPPPAPPSSTTPTISPPSATSSPSHEFSFTISLHSTNTSNNTPHKAKNPPPPSLAIDLSPADDIFFHGHLLPLHLLSHLPVSPRSSSNSLDSFTLPIRDLLDDQATVRTCSNYGDYDDDIDIDIDIDIDRKTKQNQSGSGEIDETPQGRGKLRSFSLFGIPRWKKVKAGEGGGGDRDDKEKHRRKKPSFDMAEMLRRYARLVRPFLAFKGKRKGVQFNRQAYSFSGNMNRRKNEEFNLRRPQFSAPASMRTSPTNSGLLVPTATLPSSTSDHSTMEELQAAIQAAIAHCKNSIAAEEKLKA